MQRPDKAAVLARIQAAGAIAVIRTATDNQAIETARATIAGGFEIIEITFGVPHATEVIAALVSHHPDLLIGAGTVLTAEEVDFAVDAGADFLVSPCTLPEMIMAAQERDVVCIPGAFTPTEIYNAYSLGADIVKIFPAVANGPQYLRAMRGPLPQIPIMPTSGVDLSNVADWFRAGAFAVGAVSSVLDPLLIQSGDWSALTKRAAEFMAAVRNAR
jgi:2-dehydro-3-deoxyphosphogluconate aldolase/(4S)-4-hydroxy-2-oxoglutarate aldolase